MSHFRPILNHFGVTEQQWRILRLLDEHGPLEPRELCDMSQILSSSMAGVLARMEEIDLISRNPIVDDKRRILVQLAARGDKLIGEIALLIDLQYAHLEDAFGKTVIINLLNAFEGFIAAEPDVVSHVLLPVRPDTFNAVEFNQEKESVQPETHHEKNRKVRKK